MFGTYLFFIIGCGLAIFGFATMQHPIHFPLVGYFSPQVVGYYQRMVLDRDQRNQLRLLGMLISFFGWEILTRALDGLLKLEFVQAVSEGFGGLLMLSFIAVFVFGLIRAIAEGIRGRGAELMFGWRKVWKESMELGPVAFDAAETRMAKERQVFTAAYSVLVASTVLVVFVLHITTSG